MNKEISVELLNNNSIILSNETEMCKQVQLYLTEVVKVPGGVRLIGYKLLSTKEPLEVTCTMRTVLYLNTKNPSNTPFVKEKWKNFYEGELQEIEPVYNFMVNILTNSKGIGYALTFKKLQPLTKAVFEAYLKGEQPSEISEVPFNMGTVEIPSASGNFIVNFGKFNGNSGVNIINPMGIKIPVNYKHLKESVYKAAQYIKTVCSSEKVAHAQTIKEAETILERF